MELCGVRVDDNMYLGIDEPVENIIFETANTRRECTTDYILAHDTFSINGIKFKKD